MTIYVRFNEAKVLVAMIVVDAESGIVYVIIIYYNMYSTCNNKQVCSESGAGT